MEVEVLQEVLTKALNHTARLANTRAELSILGSVLIKTSGSQVIISSTNLEIANTQKINAKIIKQGSITVPARLISEFIQNLSKGKISLVVKQNVLTITSKEGVSKVNGASDEEFPEIPYIEASDATEVIIPSNIFKQAVTQTIICVSSDTTRQVLTGVYWHTNQKHLFIAATDGYRLAEKKIMKVNEEIDVIIPADALQEVLRTLSDEDENITVLLSDTQVQFIVGENIVTSRLIDGNFPDYRQLIPEKSTNTCKIDAADFLRIIKIARLFSRDTGGAVTLSIESEKLTIKSIATELGENTSEIPVKTTGKLGMITLNSKYIHEALSVIDNKDITLSFSGEMSPCIFQPKEEASDYTHIIMPIKN